MRCEFDRNTNDILFYTSNISPYYQGFNEVWNRPESLLLGGSDGFIVLVVF
jgi:hypothetical protein